MSRTHASTRVDGENEFDQPRTDSHVIIPFGKHKGKPLALDVVPIDYVVWLAGYFIYSDGNVVHRLDEETHSIWSDRSAFREGNCICGAPEGVHDATCYGFCLGTSEEDTKRKLIEAAENGTAEFRVAKLLRPWIWVWRNHPDVVKLANDILRGVCWKCSGRLVPIGTSRANGRSHDDWDERRFHKTCWIRMQQEDL